MVWYGFVGWHSLVWGGQMTSEFIHEETGMDDWHK